MVLSDMVMPHMSGLEFLEKVKKLLPRTEIALMTGHGSIETAVQAMKLGAYDYITKPFSPIKFGWWKKTNFCDSAWIRKLRCTESWARPREFRRSCAWWRG
jgi:response regulator RpfG family c-di-GMP phosphodiesterase